MLLKGACHEASILDNLNVEDKLGSSATLKLGLTRQHEVKA
jgi:hypothetical protein